MRVMLVNGSLPPMKCGVGDYVKELAVSLAGHGCDVAVVTSAQAVKSINGVDVFPVMSSWSFLEFTRVFRVIRSWQPDVVHIQFPSRGYRSYLLPSLVPIFASIIGVPLIRTWHEIPERGQARAFLVQSFPPGHYIYVRPAFQQKLTSTVRRLMKWSKGHFIRGASVIPRMVLDQEGLARVRQRYLGGKQRLIVFFGFLYEFKGVEQVLEIADLESDQVVIAGEPGEDAIYVDKLRRLVTSSRFAGSVTMTGFLDPAEVGELLAAADAVVLPFRRGGGVWNSSIHAAVLQRTPVVTTSIESVGLDSRKMVYYARPDDIEDMRNGLAQVAGVRRAHDPELDADEWNQVAIEHIRIYQEVVKSEDPKLRPSNA